jgi:hypothetical protein
MRLSEAILLGSALVVPEKYGVLHKHNHVWSGCVYGMALFACGLRTTRSDSAFKYLKQWTWSTEKPPSNPGLCECNPLSDELLSLGDYRGYIAHYFNEHVMQAVRPYMTIEELVDWVRSVEPSETDKGISGAAEIHLGLGLGK